jgi:cytidylate kinase
MEYNCCVVAVDGTAASGKGTLCKKLASFFGFDYLDTGSLYRLTAYMMISRGVNYDNLSGILQVISETDYMQASKFPIHTEEVSNMASKIAALPDVRKALFQFQKDFPIGKNGVVVDGRDIGTVIFPNADVKLFITATTEIRAQRRYNQLQNTGKEVIFDDVLRDLRERDERDIRRAVAPTVAAPEAVLIDTTDLDVDSVLELAIALTKKAVEACRLAA